MEFEKKTLEESRERASYNYNRSQEEDVLEKSYIKAVAENDEIYAAEVARNYRNKLLSSCDNQLVSDRPNDKLEAWKTYRKALRDVPEQEGFPLNITWPVKP